jgi:16S rRNA (adenine(1408)-N(1))-methyltransferase
MPVSDESHPHSLGDVRQVVGKATRELPAAEFARQRSAYRALVLDIGTGDGKHALATARRHPDTFVVGVDANAEAMRQVSARAVAKPTRGGAPNVIFVWASVAQLPGEFVDVDEVHVLMPWGSLLRALVRPDAEVLRGIARACVPAARFLITLNLHAWRPPVPEVGTTPEPTPDYAVGELATAYARSGWQIESADYLSPGEVAELATSWTKRLRSSRDQLDVLALRGRIEP